MSRAVRIRAISVSEVDSHVLGHWHVHQDQPLCKREKETAGRKHIYRKKPWQQGRKSAEVRCRDKKERARIPPSPVPVPVHQPCFSLEAHWLLGFSPPWGMMPNSKGRGTHHSVGLLQGPKNVFDQVLKTVSQGKKSQLRGGWLHSPASNCSTIPLVP